MQQANMLAARLEFGSILHERMEQAPFPDIRHLVKKHLVKYANFPTTVQDTLSWHGFQLGKMVQLPYMTNEETRLIEHFETLYLYLWPHRSW